MKQAKQWGNNLRLALLIALLVATIQWHPALAHGGVVIDSGYTDHFEWLVSINPFPTLMGEAMLTLLIYDVVNYDPVNDAKVHAYLAAPDAPRPCCQPETHRGPIELLVDPALYPGDYSNTINLDQPGEWEMQFVVDAGDRSFTIVVPLTVNASMGGSEPIAVDGPTVTPDVAATATVFAQNVAAARAQNSPLAVPDSPLAQPISPLVNGDAQGSAAPPAVRSNDWLLWGALAVLPIALVGWWILRSTTTAQTETSDHHGDDGSTTSSGDNNA